MIDNLQAVTKVTRVELGHILIVWHSRTGASEALARAAAQGAGPRAKVLGCASVEPRDLLDASAYLFVCPENLAAMSGLMKEMFDRCYYEVLGKIEGRGYATLIAAGSDGEGAQRQIDRIVTGWRLRRVADPVIVCTEAQTQEKIMAQKQVSAASLEQSHDLGAAMAEGIALGIY